MIKLRKNLLLAMIAAMLAFAGVACEEGAEDPADTGTDIETEDPGLEEEDPALES